jgi:hypothetical protein
VIVIHSLNPLHFNFSGRFRNVVKTGKDVLYRLPCGFIGNSVQAILGTVGFVLTCGRFKSSKKWACKLYEIPSPSAELFKDIVLIMNPQAAFPCKESDEAIPLPHCAEIVTHLASQGNEYYKDKNPNLAELGKRFIALGAEVFMPIALSVDFFMGLVASVFSLLSLGTIPLVNRFTYISLRSDALVISNLCQWACLVIDPDVELEEVTP